MSSQLDMYLIDTHSCRWRSTYSYLRRMPHAAHATYSPSPWLIC